MSPYLEGNKTFTVVTAAVSTKRLVKLSGEKVLHNTITETDEPIGASLYDGAVGDDIAVKLLNNSGTVEVTASTAIAAGADCYAAADGKVSALSATPGDYKKVGKAMKAASGDGSIFEMLPYPAFTITTVT